MKTYKAIFILAALAAGTSVYADKIAFSQAPPTVQQAIRARSGHQRIEDIDKDSRNGQVTYEASWKNQSGQQQELLVADDGKILRDVPSAIKGKASAVSNATVTNSNLNVTSAPGAVTATNAIAGFTGAQQAPMNWAAESVQNKVKSLANGANIDSFQKGQFRGKTAYQATFQQNGQARTVVIGEDATVLASAPRGFWARNTSGTTPSNAAALTETQQAPLNWAAESVQNKFKSLANGASIENFQKGKYQGRTAYQGAFTQNGMTTTVIMGEDGTVLSSTPTAAGAAGQSVTGSSTK